MTLVAFNGKFGSGKDKAGERLAEMSVVPATRLSFARLLKESAAALFGIPVEDWETYKNDPDVKILLQVGWTTEVVMGKEVDVPNIIVELTAREFLQRYGTESHRDIFGADFWVEQALRNYYYEATGLTYITDCRFENEANAVRALGGVVVNVVGADDNTGTHLSEAGLPSNLVNFVIDNTKRDDDYQSLDQQLRSIASVVGIPVQ